MDAKDTEKAVQLAYQAFQTWKKTTAKVKWASTRENLSSVVFEQQMHRPACASTQSDQHLCYSFIGKYHNLDLL